MTTLYKSAVAATYNSISNTALASEFHTVWASGVVMAALTPDTYPMAIGAANRSQISGVDSFTGKDILPSLREIFGSGATLSLYYIVDAAIADRAAFDARMVADFRTTIDSNIMGRDLYRELTAITGSPQLQLVVDVPNASGSTPPATDVRELDLSLRVYLDPELETKITVGTYIELVAYKSGGYAGGWQGDFRIFLSMERSDSSGLFYRLSLDNVANGEVVIPSVAAEYAANGGVKTTYQSTFTAGGSVTYGWNTLRLYIKRPVGGRSDITTGRCFATMTPDGGDTLAICDFVGGIQTGTEDLPWNRMAFNCYSNASATAPISLRLGALEMWSQRYSPI